MHLKNDLDRSPVGEDAFRHRGRSIVSPFDRNVVTPSSVGVSADGRRSRASSGGKKRQRGSVDIQTIHPDDEGLTPEERERREKERRLANNARER